MRLSEFFIFSIYTVVGYIVLPAVVKKTWPEATKAVFHVIWAIVGFFAVGLIWVVYGVKPDEVAYRYVLCPLAPKSAVCLPKESAPTTTITEFNKAIDQLFQQAKNRPASEASGRSLITRDNSFGGGTGQNGSTPSKTTVTPPSIVAKSPPPSSRDAERAWKALTVSSTPEEFEAFVQVYSASTYAEEAQRAATLARTLGDTKAEISRLEQAIKDLRLISTDAAVDLEAFDKVEAADASVTAAKQAVDNYNKFPIKAPAGESKPKAEIDAEIEANMQKAQEAGEWRIRHKLAAAQAADEMAEIGTEVNAKVRRAAEFSISLQSILSKR